MSGSVKDLVYELAPVPASFPSGHSATVQAFTSRHGLTPSEDYAPRQMLCRLRLATGSFKATRRPNIDLDRMDRYTRNQAVAVLRRGRVFQLVLPESDRLLELPAICSASKKILAVSEEDRTSVCTHRADERSYGLMDHHYAKAEDVSLICTRDHRAPPEVIAHLAVLPLRYLSEIVALAMFARRHLGWTKTVSPPVHAYVEAAAAASGVQKDDTPRTATALPTTCMRLLECYRPRSAATASRLPALFNCRAWNATCRGGRGQDVKIGFMPAGNPEDLSGRWDEKDSLLHLSLRQPTPTHAPLSGVPGPPRVFYD
ncbi:hypothetical protein DL764_002537 [Monosporascus ibericus]|uniref:Uncharacterized protein n=1 Tax=Monosporascus ibericus TaxID=155417 RepID=A0A4Q4TLS1_9PEZI|nr:hypothetical protein DL764_002537 [Monosporascus ibericus]